ncbi:hypothetical protein BY996DRAFT_7400055 [Phakopsora pachyrhizi]|nr:hypothetical protein BY996DRAFT_7400055 [Phakopsora pachyrhizi]
MVGVYNKLNALNRSVESVNLIGRQFHHVNDLWSKLSLAPPTPPHPFILLCG